MRFRFILYTLHPNRENVKSSSDLRKDFPTKSSFRSRLVSRIDEGVPKLDVGDIFQLGQFNPLDRFDMLGRDGKTIKG